MHRRLAVLFVAALAIVACQPAAPTATPIADAKEILVQSVASLKDVQTIQVTGELTGSVVLPGMGSLDLEGTTGNLALDIASTKLKASFSAPALLGTAAEAIVVDNFAYVKMTGLLASFVGADATGRYSKEPVEAGDAEDLAEDPQKAIDELRAQLDELPVEPTKAADEKCGDRDCYRITLTLSESELRALNPGQEIPASSVVMDLWSQQDNLRPALMRIAVDAGEQGAVTMNFAMTYDAPLSIEAPPADQIADQ